MKFKKVINEHFKSSGISKVTKNKKLSEGMRRALYEGADTLYKGAMDAYNRGDEDWFYDRTDDELVDLWVSCKLSDTNPYGAAYDDEVYDAIYDRPNSNELFDAADEITVRNFDDATLRKVYKRYFQAEPSSDMQRSAIEDSVLDAIKDYKYKNEGWTHFEFTSGANPYIAKTKEDADRVKRSRGDSAKFVGNIDGIDYYTIDDSNDDRDMFAVDLEESKEPAQDKKPLNEGPGAGYAVKGIITNAHLNNVKECKFSHSDDYGNYYEVELDATATFEDIEAHSYYYGGEVGDAPISIIRCVINSEQEPTDEDIIDALSGAKVDVIIGGGWSHSTFDGFIEASVEKGELDTYYDVLDRVLFEITEKSYVYEIDDLVTGAYENDEEDMDESLTESYQEVAYINDGHTNFRVVGGGFNTRDALVSVEDADGRQSRLSTGDVFEFYTWYDAKGNVIREPEDMEESLVKPFDDIRA